MSKKLWCIKKGNKVVEGDYFDSKAVAKGVRNSYEGELPETPEDASAWTFHVSRGPDHRLFRK